MSGYNPDFEDVDLLELKPKSAYSKDIKDELNRLQLDKSDNISPFGSYIYRYQKFHGDIDLIEKVVANSYEELIKKFSINIKRIVKNVISQKNHYFLEMKIGTDKLYELKVGYLCNGIYYVNPEFKNNIIDLYNNKLFDKEDYDLFMKLLVSNQLNQDVFDEVVKIVRKYYVLRWSTKEIMAGKKKMRSGKMISLEEAAGHKTLCKIDTIVKLNNTFIETTNIYGLMYRDGNQLIEVSAIFKTDVLVLDVEKLYYSNMWFNPFKMLKRAYSYCRYMIETKKDVNNEHADVIKLITPFLVSNISWLSQIRGFIEDLNKILSVHGLKSLNDMNFELDNFKNFLSNIQEITLKELDEYNRTIDNIIKSKNVDFRIKLQTELIDLFTKKINYFTLIFFKSIGWEQIPDIILPNELTITRPTPLSTLVDKQCLISYDRNIKRGLNIQPKKEFIRNITNLERLHKITPLFTNLTFDKDKEDLNIRQKISNIITKKESIADEEIEDREIIDIDMVNKPKIDKSPYIEPNQMIPEPEFKRPDQTIINREEVLRPEPQNDYYKDLYKDVDEFKDYNDPNERPSRPSSRNKKSKQLSEPLTAEELEEIRLLNIQYPPAERKQNKNKPFLPDYQPAKPKNTNNDSINNKQKRLEWLQTRARVGILPQDEQEELQQLIDFFTKPLVQKKKIFEDDPYGLNNPPSDYNNLHKKMDYSNPPSHSPSPYVSNYDNIPEPPTRRVYPPSKKIQTNEDYYKDLYKNVDEYEDLNESISTKKQKWDREMAKKKNEYIYDPNFNYELNTQEKKILNDNNRSQNNSTKINDFGEIVYENVPIYTPIRPALRDLDEQRSLPKPESTYHVNIPQNIYGPDEYEDFEVMQKRMLGEGKKKRKPKRTLKKKPIKKR
jgi:hypothetical protein